MTRRKLLQLSLTASLAASASAGGAVPAGSRKKGLGITLKSPERNAKLRALRCKWFYSWGAHAPEDMQEGVGFVPMIWGERAKKEEILADMAAKSKVAGITDLLGFNEPDKKDQSNMPVEKALDAWPLLMETGMRLGSPGCAHPDREWMKTFMRGVKERGYRVDFVCVHSYGGPNPNALIQRLQQVHKLYGKPIWITEFAVGDWQAERVAQNRHKPDAVLRFMEALLPRLERLDFIERYAWFPAKPDNRALGTSALFDDEHQLTRLGQCYRDF